MRRFSETVDLRSRKEMTEYLQSHFRYDTMNAWNAATSILPAVNLSRANTERFTAGNMEIVIANTKSIATNFSEFLNSEFFNSVT